MIALEYFLKSYTLPSKHLPLNNTFCSRRNFSMDSLEEKFISRETALHFNIFFGTRAAKEKIK